MLQTALPFQQTEPHFGLDRPLRQRVTLAVANLKEATDVIIENHYLHRGRTMAQLPYWILLDQEKVGVLLYSYPRMSANFHGHHPMTLLELARMWLSPQVQGTRTHSSDGREHSFSLATCAVGQSLRRIRQDWHGKYPHLPDIEAVASWADIEHHEGIIYRAANFREVGVSGGSLHGSTYRVNGGHDQLNPDYLHYKKAFLFEFKRPLTEHQKDRAREHWLLQPASVHRIRSHKLPKMKRRIPFEAYTMALDIPPGDMRVVNGQASVA